jgi:hypothetical protein
LTYERCIQRKAASQKQTAGSAPLFLAGDRVRVKPQITPKFGWGDVKRTSVGIVKDYEKDQSTVHVAFKTSPDAKFQDVELERVFRVGDRVKRFDFAAASAAKTAAAAALAAKAAGGAQQEVHAAKCDVCGVNPVLGPMWKCKTRSTFNLCDTCYVEQVEPTAAVRACVHI